MKIPSHLLGTDSVLPGLEDPGWPSEALVSRSWLTTNTAKAIDATSRTISALFERGRSGGWLSSNDGKGARGAVVTTGGWLARNDGAPAGAKTGAA